MNHLLNELIRQQFLFQPQQEKKTFTKASVIPQDDGTYRASITYFNNGDTYSVTEIKATLEKAEAFLKERVERADLID